MKELKKLSKAQLIAGFGGKAAQRRATK